MPWNTQHGGGRDGVYEIDSYVRGAALDGDGVIVGDDHSPAGKEERFRRWQEESTDAIDAHNRKAGEDLLPLLRSWGPLDEGD